MASTCLVPHCRDTGSWADSLQEVSAPVLEWESLSCSISFPLVTHIPVPTVSFPGICHEERHKGNGDHVACPCICFSVLMVSRARETRACSQLLGQWECGQGKVLDCFPCIQPHRPILSFPLSGLWSSADLWADSVGAGSVWRVRVGSAALRAHGPGSQPLHHRAVCIQGSCFLLLH